MISAYECDADIGPNVKNNLWRIGTEQLVRCLRRTLEVTEAGYSLVRMTGKIGKENGGPNSMARPVLSCRFSSSAIWSASCSSPAPPEPPSSDAPASAAANSLSDSESVIVNNSRTPGAPPIGLAHRPAALIWHRRVTAPPHQPPPHLLARLFGWRATRLRRWSRLNFSIARNWQRRQRRREARLLRNASARQRG